MDTYLGSVKLKAGAKTKVEELIKYTVENKDLALAHMKDKGYFWDSIFVETRSDGDYMIYILKSSDFSKVKRGDSETPLNEWSKKYLEVRDEVWDGSELDVIPDLLVSDFSSSCK